MFVQKAFEIDAVLKKPQIAHLLTTENEELSGKRDVYGFLGQVSPIYAKRLIMRSHRREIRSKRLDFLLLK
ncbi:MAG: hypothetical protein S4CHLAM45_03440 [Chlamydiales bacterium]|nr:hypothetical protein [Chlamydiales bacterium]MCH9619199.1 hypothetical protein [Chlamydiales bacterium]MCH9622461.1 hypothetical protein [Chlamydiales bacterium]